MLWILVDVNNSFCSLCLDTLELFLVANESDPTPVQIPLKRKGIAWWTDKNVKFRNPPGKESLEEKFKGKAWPIIPSCSKPSTFSNVTEILSSES